VSPFFWAVAVFFRAVAVFFRGVPSFFAEVLDFVGVRVLARAGRTSGLRVGGVRARMHRSAVT